MTFRSSLWTSLPLCLPPGKPLSLIPLDPLLSADDTTHVKEGGLPVRRPAHTSSTKRPRGRGGQGPASGAVHSLVGPRTIEGTQFDGVMGRGGRVEVSGANRQTSMAAEKYPDFEIAQRFSTLMSHTEPQATSTSGSNVLCDTYEPNRTSSHV